MITVQIKGGLGNQLFQYAYGRFLMERGVEVVFDISFYDSVHSYTKRTFSLGYFLLTKKISFTHQKSQQVFWKRVLNKLDVDRRVRFIKKEQDKKEGVADGDYCSEKYFFEIRETLLKELALKNESVLFKEYKSLILSSKNPTIVHARRTDYLKSKGHTILTEEYYREARKNLEEDITIFCFSDDPEWIKDIFECEKVTVISGKGLSDFEELMLMSLGQNFIIANSTFSWWGAWLSQAKNKKVIAPKKWFTKKTWYRANRDIILADWVKV